jgi:hypothetical protein
MKTMLIRSLRWPIGITRYVAALSTIFINLTYASGSTRYPGHVSSRHQWRESRACKYRLLNLHFMTLSGSRICQIPDSGLINGVGRYEGGPSVARPRINVVAGKKYRFRVINISAYSGFTFSVEKHSLTIIEVGTSILKNDLDINTFPG